MYRYLASAFAVIFVSPAMAQTVAQTEADEMEESSEVIIVTAARTQLPASALPLTVDVIDSESLQRQVQISGSTVDAVSALLPSFSPTREKLSGAGESLRGRSPLYAINGIPQSTPVRDGSRDGYTIDPFFIDRVEVIYGSNALQGIGATGGVVNQVTVGAPSEDGIAVRALAQLTLPDGFDAEGIGAKSGALLGYRDGRSMRASAQRSNGVEPSSMALATGSGSMEHKGKSRTATAGLSLRAWGMTLRAVHGLKWWPTVLNSREMPITSSFPAIALQVSRQPACAASHRATHPQIPQSSYRLRS